MAETGQINWMECELIESVEGKCGGRPVVVGTRVFPEAIEYLAEDGETAAEIQQESFPSLSVEQIRRLIEFAREQRLRAAA